jgi:hypothetical protein
MGEPEQRLSLFHNSLHLYHNQEVISNKWTVVKPKKLLRRTWTVNSMEDFQEMVCAEFLAIVKSATKLLTPHLVLHDDGDMDYHLHKLRTVYKANDNASFISAVEGGIAVLGVQPRHFISLDAFKSKLLVFIELVQTYATLLNIEMPLTVEEIIAHLDRVPRCEGFSIGGRSNKELPVKPVLPKPPKHSGSCIPCNKHFTSIGCKRGDSCFFCHHASHASKQ